MSHDSLVSLVLAKDESMKALKAELAKFQRKDRDDRERDLIQAQIVPIQTLDANSLFLVERRGKKQVQFSLRGQFAVALRRNFGNIAASSLGSTLLENISHQSVVRFEVALHAAYGASGAKYPEPTPQ